MRANIHSNSLFGYSTCHANAMEQQCESNNEDSETTSMTMAYRYSRTVVLVATFRPQLWIRRQGVVFQSIPDETMKR